MLSVRLGASAMGAVFCLLTGAVASAAPIAIGVDAFGPGSTLETFSTSVGHDVHGLSVGGLSFQYSQGTGHVFITIGPGLSNHVSDPGVVSVGDNSGELSVSFASPLSAFGFGYALLAFDTITPGATITLFNGGTNLGSLSYTASLDPTFSGGFAGIESATAFDRAVLSFDSTSALAFAVDNIRTRPAAVPEPASLALIGAALAGAALRRRTR